MNKIFNINLGGYPFTIDDDAYHTLDKYLSTIKKHFANSEGCEDIIADIEIRIAELFNEELKGQPIVGIREVDKVIKVMGTPEEFGATEEDHVKHKGQKTDAHRESKRYTTGKRLFRDPDEKVIGGVCSGLSAYFGINEPVWLRILFVFAFFTGVGIMLYVVLWIAIPEAKSSGDKLSMKGEKIDVTNIARKVEEEINNLTNTISEMTKEFNSKKKV